DPATGKELLRIQDGNSDDALKALTAADEVQAEWAQTAPRERAEILRRAFDLVHERAEDFALLMTLEMGKPLAESRGEVTNGGEFLRWFAAETVPHYGPFADSPAGTPTMIVSP